MDRNIVKKEPAERRNYYRDKDTDKIRKEPNAVCSHVIILYFCFFFPT